MGNHSSTQNHIDIGDLATNYSYEVKYTDSRFGEIKLLRRKDTGDKIFQKDFTTNVSKEFEDYINKIKSRIPLLHPNIIKILGYNSRKEDLLCADFFKISLFFEAFETDLEKEIYRRHAVGEYFSEIELRCLLDSIISACAFLQKNQIAHGDIRPYNIVITKNKEYKVCENSLFQSVYNPAYFSVLEGLEAKSHYPSPQVFKFYKGGKGKNSEFDPYKNDIYGLGMTILMAAQLEKIDNAYDYDTKKIKQDVLDDSLGDLRGRYSEGLVEAIRMLLNLDEGRRPDFVTLDDEIKHYRPDVRARVNLERTLEAQRRQTPMETPVKSGFQQQQSGYTPTNPTAQNPANPLFIDDELDKRVRKAVEKSETMINRSPARVRNEILDNTIQTYLRKDPLDDNDRPLLYKLSPHLTMQSRLVPTLKVYSQDQGRLSTSQYHAADVASNLYVNPEQVTQSYYPQEPVVEENRQQTFQPQSLGGEVSRPDSYPTQPGVTEYNVRGVSYQTASFGENPGYTGTFGNQPPSYGTETNYAASGAYDRPNEGYSYGSQVNKVQESYFAQQNQGGYGGQTGLKNSGSYAGSQTGLKSSGSYGVQTTQQQPDLTSQVNIRLGNSGTYGQGGYTSYTSQYQTSGTYVPQNY